MRKLGYLIIAYVVLVMYAMPSYGQGCSDAGFCTINSFKPNSLDSATISNKQIKVGAFYGKADNSILVYGNYLEYNQQLTDKFGFNGKITSLAQSGNGISVFGLSDIFLNATYKVVDNTKLTLGVKVPLSAAGKTHNGLPLPMDYQASLGTFDLVVGVAYQIKKVQLVAAIQQPITQNNNMFIASSYPAESNLSTFQSTKNFKRSGDVLLRVSYPISIGSKLVLTPSLLPIYHLSNDKFTNELNIEQEIAGSKGLTLNGNIYFDYNVSKSSTIQLNVGMPFIVRDARPDGLTRSFIANLEYQFNF
ncbi:hypothetical protein [Tenuifilum thalassicum]|uniref:Uncharacterized protein n=1 Tax=Tenuifilum thalassicum TaxID=2590900 RepID=A0A7D4CFR3_9BACT|nr:hypothetical protein [Tenuifilum thalassicum]QKG79226.1 hypothetical protein FHG85_02760 [Tenuifilum thalassicum]